MVKNDDGEEKTKYISVTGKRVNGTTLPEIRVPMADFHSMRWITKFWGFGAVVRAGQAKTDQLREAIQRLSPELVQRTIYTHTGWRKAGDKMVFLFSGGAIGAENMQVQLDPSVGDIFFKLDLRKNARHATKWRRKLTYLTEVGAPTKLPFHYSSTVHLAPCVSKPKNWNFIPYGCWELPARP